MGFTKNKGRKHNNVVETPGPKQKHKLKTQVAEHKSAKDSTVVAERQLKEAKADAAPSSTGGGHGTGCRSLFAASLALSSGVNPIPP